MVVRSGLKPGMVTLHMFAAIVLVSLLLYGTFQATEEHWTAKLPEALRTRLLKVGILLFGCLLYTSPSPRHGLLARMPSSA
mgnify:CR=1 FL=1